MENTSQDTNQMPAQTETAPVATPTTDIPAAEGKKKRPLVVILCIVLVLLVGGAYGLYIWMQKRAIANAPIKIGVMLPFSGGGSTAGFGELKGIQLAKKQLGANKVELIQEDSKCEAEDAKAALKRLVAKGVVAIIGEACSGASLGALSDANQSKVVMISPSASSPELSVKDDYFFRVVPPDQFQGQYAAQIMYDNDLTKVSIIYSDEAYGQGLRKSFENAFAKLGGTVASSRGYQDGVIDLSKEVAEAKAANPQALYIVGITAPSAAALLSEIKSQGIQVPVYSGDALNDDVIIQNAQGAAEGLTLTSFPIGTRTFRQALENAFAADDQTYGAAQAYDAFTALYKTIQSGARTGEQIKAKLSTTSFDGVSGPISFDAFGEISDPDYKYTILQVKDGEFVPEE